MIGIIIIFLQMNRTSSPLKKEVSIPIKALWVLVKKLVFLELNWQ